MNIRPFVEDDAPAIAALISADEERFYGRPGRLTGEDILMFLPYNKEAWVWEEDGRVVASALFGVHGEAVNLRGFVAKKGCGLGTEIVDRGEAFARPSPTMRHAPCSNRGAIARCVASTRW